MSYFYDPYRQQKKLINDIAKAINGQYSAIHCYEKIARMAAAKDEREQILEIRNDEIRHFQQFSHIYTTLTGRQHTPSITEKCPDTYRDGLESAFKDEQETKDFYQDIADAASDPYTKETFRRASADEQNHAVWFLYFMMKNQN